MLPMSPVYFVTYEDGRTIDSLEEFFVVTVSGRTGAVGAATERKVS